MLLSNKDIKHIEKLGHDRKKFVRYDSYGFARLKNYGGLCAFFDAEKYRCQIYKHRPLGCQIYPVIYSEQEGILVDDLCPMKNTVSRISQKKEGKKLIELLHRIDIEARSRVLKK